MTRNNGGEKKQSKKEGKQEQEKTGEESTRGVQSTPNGGNKIRVNKTYSTGVMALKQDKQTDKNCQHALARRNEGRR